MKSLAKSLNSSFFKISEYSGRDMVRMEEKNKLKGELASKNMFIAFSVILFAFFMLDISLTTISIGQTMTSIINLIPLI